MEHKIIYYYLTFLLFLGTILKITEIIANAFFWICFFSLFGLKELYNKRKEKEFRKKVNFLKEIVGEKEKHYFRKNVFIESFKGCLLNMHIGEKSFFFTGLVDNDGIKEIFDELKVELKKEKQWFKIRKKRF